MAASRSWTNTLLDYDKDNPALHLYSTNGQLSEVFIGRIRSRVLRLVGELDVAVSEGRADGLCAKHDGSVYTGVTGVALVYVKLYQVFNDKSFMDKACKLSQSAVKCLKTTKPGRLQTFLCGDTGVLAVAAHLHKTTNESQKAHEYAQRVLQHAEQVHQTSDGHTANEFLYGRVGLLYSVLYIHEHVQAVPLTVIDQLSNDMLQAGVSFARVHPEHKAPLLYEWHSTIYLGAAHGVAGILYTLMKNERVLNAERVLVQSALDWMQSLVFPSGNVPSSLGNGSDKLVQWCHGAPGCLYMWLQAHKVFGNEQYLARAVQCGQVIWQHGLLRKGNGLCHGVSGNAYALLTLYRHTNDLLWLHRTCSFVEWLLSDEHQAPAADRPFSLMEGMGGLIYFLTDILKPDLARFPAFELPPF